MSKNPGKSVCFYFQVHQPLRLTKFTYFDIGTGKDYFTHSGGKSNQAYLQKVANKCYYPMNNLLLKLLKKHPELRFSFSISGIALEQFWEFEPECLKSFQELVKTKRVEMLSETYYHSLSFLYSKLEFAEQINLHRKAIWKYFRTRPKIFRNTELIYNNEIANFVRKLGFQGILAEGWDYFLQDRSPNYMYEAPKFKLQEGDAKVVKNQRFVDKISPKIYILLKNYRLSDDVAFRFSDKTWKGFPLTAEKYADWVAETPGDTINLFMDFETFGEHQWEDTGIFEFFARVPEELIKRGVTFKTPSQTIKEYSSRGILDIHQLMSWADMERDLSAWLGNKMQQEAMRIVFQSEQQVRDVLDLINDISAKDMLLHTWRRLQTSDHFYYMSTKYWNDGDIHAYFSPYDSPYDAYINFMNIFNDFKFQLTNYVRRKL